MSSHEREIGVLATQIRMFEKKIDLIETTIGTNHKEIMSHIEKLENKFASKRVEKAVQGTIIIILSSFIVALVALVAR